MTKNTLSFPDHNQNFWQLASIQGASQGLAVLLTGGLLAKQYGLSIALPSILVGNLILWIIGLGVIAMSIKRRQNIIQTVQEYLGKTGSFLIILILTSAFILWYTIELQVSMEVIKPLFPENWNSTILGLSLGIFISVLSTGGIRFIKWLCVYSFPIFLCFLTYILFTQSKFELVGDWGLSFSAIILEIVVALPGVVNFGIFFRHSHSRADSVFGLTLTSLIYILFEAGFAILYISNPNELLSNNIINNNSIFYTTFSAFFIILFLICTNIANIYFACAGLEALLPRNLISKGSLLVGLIGSLFYFFTKSSSWIFSLEEIIDNFIVNLGVVLLISFFIKNLVKHRPEKWERGVNNICWFMGCASMLIIQVFYPGNSNRVSLSGIWGTLLTFILIMFIEQIIYSFKIINPITKIEE